MRSRKNLLLLGLSFSLLFYASTAYVLYKYKPSAHAEDTRRAITQLIARIHSKEFNVLPVAQKLLEEYYTKKEGPEFLSNHYISNNLAAIFTVGPDTYEELTPGSGMPENIPPTLRSNNGIPQQYIVRATSDRLMFSWVFALKTSKKEAKTHVATFIINKSLLKRYRETIPFDWTIYNYDKDMQPSLDRSGYIDEELQWLTEKVKLQKFDIPTNEPVITNMVLPEFEVIDPKGATILVIPIAINISEQFRQIIFYTTPAIYLQDDYRDTSWLLLSVFTALSLLITGASYYFSRNTGKK